MEKPYLREGVDIYVEDNDSNITTVIFVFLSTRKRIQMKVRKNLVASLPLFNGENSIDDILAKTKSSRSELEKFVSYLELNGILLPKNWLENIRLDANYKGAIEKQLYFLMDILNSPEAVSDLQKRILQTKIAIIGVGSTGSWMLVELLQMGFQDFKLFDYKNVKEDSISRHAFFEQIAIGRQKAIHYKEIAKKINPAATIESHAISINTDMEVFEKLHDIDLIINCADEPYIGYTSIFLSRYSIKYNKILFVAGGFDAHLGCLGELIVPYKTPCSDCYNEFFKESLKDWKPSPHPVKDRIKGFGGLPALSVFSASTGALIILRYFINKQEFIKTAGGRGEFKFDDYKIDAFDVKRNEKCEVCGE
jgi:molybdopterin/thiamine biosynthesis adenylyltransferase